MASVLNINYPQHETIFAESFLDFFMKNIFFDLVFICKENIPVKTHKTIIAPVSEFLLEIMKTSSQEIVCINLPDVDHKELAIFVNFLYEGVAKVSVEQLKAWRDIISLLCINLPSVDILSSEPAFGSINNCGNDYSLYTEEVLPYIETTGVSDDVLQSDMCPVVSENPRDIKNDISLSSEDNDPLSQEIPPGSTSQDMILTSEDTQVTLGFSTGMVETLTNGEQKMMLKTADSSSERRNTMSLSSCQVKRTSRQKRKLLCESCSRRFANLKTLKAHSCKEDKELKCVYCYATIEVEQYANHISLHTWKKPYKCPVCKKCFDTRSSLLLHLRVHTGEKPYSCAVCGAKFKQKSHLDQHTRLHTGEKPYQCDTCEAVFAQASHLSHHIASHAKGGSGKLQCKVCSSFFVSKRYLMKHYFKQHCIG